MYSWYNHLGNWLYNLHLTTIWIVRTVTRWWNLVTFTTSFLSFYITNYFCLCSILLCCTHDLPLVAFVGVLFKRFTLLGFFGLLNKGCTCLSFLWSFSKRFVYTRMHTNLVLMWLNVCLSLRGSTFSVVYVYSISQTNITLSVKHINIKHTVHNNVQSSCISKKCLHIVFKDSLLIINIFVYWAFTRQPT